MPTSPPCPWSQSELVNFTKKMGGWGRTESLLDPSRLFSRLREWKNSLELRSVSDMVNQRNKNYMSRWESFERETELEKKKSLNQARIETSAFRRKESSPCWRFLNWLDTSLHKHATRPAIPMLGERSEAWPKKKTRFLLLFFYGGGIGRERGDLQKNSLCENLLWQ